MGAESSHFPLLMKSVLSQREEVAATHQNPHFLSQNRNTPMGMPTLQPNSWVQLQVAQTIVITTLRLLLAIVWGKDILTQLSSLHHNLSHMESIFFFFHLTYWKSYQGKDVEHSTMKLQYHVQFFHSFQINNLLCYCVCLNKSIWKTRNLKGKRAQ